LTPADVDGASRYKKGVYRRARIDNLFEDLFLEAYRNPPNEFVLNFDAADDSVCMAGRKGASFTAIAAAYRLMPLYATCGGASTSSAAHCLPPNPNVSHVSLLCL